MSLALATEKLFKAVFFTFFPTRRMKKQEDTESAMAEQTKLELDDIEMDVEEDAFHQKESVKKEKEDSQRNHKDQESTLTYPQPEIFQQDENEDDIDLNDVEDLQEDEEEEEEEDENVPSSANYSSDGKDLIGQTSLQISGQPHQRPRKKKKNRKVRTTITRQKLAAMNQIFAQYTRNKEEGKNPRLNLKEIGNQLSLGYSTILHKFRQFRSTKMVKGGALIASLQKKRKYKKSLVIEEIIDKALASRPFYTAVELSEYIYKIHGKRFSRSIISRHLGEMGYSYKNLKSSPIQKNKPKYKQTRRVYADIVYPYLSSPTMTVLYMDELACNVATFQRRRLSFNPKELYQENANDYVSLIVGATIEGLQFFQVKYGFYTQDDFLKALQSCLTKIMQTKFGKKVPGPEDNMTLILITDMNKIHLDPFGVRQDLKPIKALTKKYNTRRFYLPPASPHLNPLESLFTYLKTKLLKKDIKSSSDLRNYMQSCMEQMSKVSVQVYFEDAVKCVQASKSEQSYSFNENNASSGFSLEL